MVTNCPRLPETERTFSTNARAIMAKLGPAVTLAVRKFRN